MLIDKIQLTKFNVDIPLLISRIFPSQNWLEFPLGTAAAGITLGALGAAVLRANRAKSIPTKAFENELGPLGGMVGWLIVKQRKKMGGGKCAAIGKVQGHRP